MALEGRVQLVDVGLMVLAVMDLHRLRIDVGLEGRVVVGKIRKTVGTCHEMLLSNPVWVGVGIRQDPTQPAGSYARGGRWRVNANIRGGPSAHRGLAPPPVGGRCRAGP